MPISDDLMDRLKAAFVLTDSAIADGAPAIRVQYVAGAAAGTPGRIPDNLMDRIKGACIVSDAAMADGAPALRGQAV